MTDKIEATISLDNTLRYLYITLRNRRVTLVAIEFSYDGKLWRADTVEEALELRKALQREDFVASTGAELVSEKDHYWTPDVTTELLQSLGEHQKSFLRTLYEHKDWLPSDQIVKELSLDSEVSFAGVLSGLSKQAKKLDIMPWKVYEVQVSWKAKKKTRFFKLSPGFRWAADELSWPDNWI